MRRGHDWARLRDVWLIAAAGWAAAIVVVGTLPTQPLVTALAPQREAATTMAGHFLEYCVLAILVSGALRATQSKAGRALWPVAIAAMLGALVEAVQAFLPYRDAQLGDAMVNLLGATVGAAAFGVVWAARRSRRSRRA